MTSNLMIFRTTYDISVIAQLDPTSLLNVS